MIGSHSIVNWFIGMTRGFKAVITQSYTEANIKLGVEHEGSTLLTVLGSGSNDTIFLTGSSPVALKSRSISYTGDGVTAFIFEGPTYTDGIDTPYQNPNAINPVIGLSKIFVGSLITDDGVLIFAPENLLGNTSNQGKGSTNNDIGQEKILKPNTAYLFRLKSLDSSTQQISSILSWYEGELDFPL